MTVLCFGEMLVRFAPDMDGTLGEADALRLHVAGAEANVAISLASLGTSARMATVLPDNALGARALQTLVAHGVRTDAACGPRRWFFL
jgi:2-dehydro-3-deoxygluconokinase